MRKLKIDMSELEMAFQTDRMSEMEYFLDMESGKVVMATHDDNSAVDEFFEETDSEAEEGALDAKFDEWLEEYDCPGWQMDNIRDAFVVACNFPGRFIRIPKEESRDGYQDMVDFAEDLPEGRLRDLLFVALNGKGAFRRFKDVLLSYPEQRERWFEFSAERLRNRILEWLEDEEIELVSS